MNDGEMTLDDDRDRLLQYFLGHFCLAPFPVLSSRCQQSQMARACRAVTKHSNRIIFNSNSNQPHSLTAQQALANDGIAEEEEL
jgi:hypothetical protein